MRVALALLVLALLAIPRLAGADDGGDAAVSDDGGVPVACDGALCDTTNDATCDMGHGTKANPATVVLLAAALTMVALRRRSRITRYAGCGVLAATLSSSAWAAPVAVDVVVRDEPPPRRYVSIAWNPVPLFGLAKVSFDVVIAPLAHHAIVVSPFYANTSTAPIWTYDPSGNNPVVLPQQKFEGFGGELGYRYYFGDGGLRGVFVGPSFIIGAFTATAQNTSQTQFLQLGGAVDVGYQALVADCVSLGAGVGLQYTFADVTGGAASSIPNQQYPARVYANGGVFPRLLLSIGWAF